MSPPVTPRTLRLCLVIAAVSSSALLALYQVRTFDTFFHLASGRLISEAHQVPQADPFSFTFPGAPWQNHSWGYQVMLFALHELGGFAALSLLQALVVGALSAFALSTVWHWPLLLPAGALLVVLPPAGYREVVEARPHMLGYLLLTVSLVLVQGERARKRPLWLVVLLPTYALWTTIHGSHLLMFVVLGVAAIGALFDRQRALAGALAGAFVACLALGLVLSPDAFLQGSEHVGSSFLETSVHEWAPVTSEVLFSSIQGRTFLAVVMLAILGLGLLGIEPKNSPVGGRSVQASLLLGTFALLGFSSTRMLALFALGAAPVWLPPAAHAVTAIAQRFAPRLPRTPRIAVALLGISLLTAYTLRANREMFRVGAGLMAERFPIAAVKHLRERARIHRLYNAYNFGGYLIWERTPREGVFVDGRAITVYPSAFLERFEAAYGDPALFESLAAQYDIDGVLMPTTSAKTRPLIAYLQKHPRFVLAHEDDVACVFERRD